MGDQSHQDGVTVSAVLGTIVWLMSRSKAHKQLRISDLEDRVMPAILLNQFRIYYKGDAPLACVLYAKQAAAPQTDAFSIPQAAKDWKTGPHVTIADVIAPFGDPQNVAAHFLSEEAAKTSAQR